MTNGVPDNSRDAPDKLTNGDVRKALEAYKKFRKRDLDSEFRQNFRPAKMFGLDLSRVHDARAAIESLVEKQREEIEKQAAPNLQRRRLGSAEPTRDKLDPFRRELILVSAAATRQDTVALTLGLYCALMERQRTLGAEGDDGQPSAAAEYILRCMAVQAAYHDFVSYLFVIDRFRRVVQAIKASIGANPTRDIVECLKAACRAPEEQPDPVPPKKPDAGPETEPKTLP